MSLINSVLRDLDKRRADASGVVPNEVRPLPADSSGTSFRQAAIVLGLALLAVGAWLAYPMVAERERPAAGPAVAVQPAPAAVAPAPAPAPVVAAPAPAPAPVTDAAPLLPATPTLIGILKLDDSLDRLPSAPPREKPKESKKADKGDKGDKGENKPMPMPGPAASPAPATAKPDPVPATARASSAEPAAKPAIAVVEDDWTRAQGLLRENRAAEAEPLLRQVLQKNPGQTPARQALIGILLPAQRHAEAAVVLRDGQALSPEQTGWAMNLARLQTDRNDYAAAWEALSRSLPHAQQQPDYLAFCGTVLQRLNRSGEAVTYYQNALRIRPQEGRWWVGLGIALEAERKTADAREAYQRARGTGSLAPELASFVDQKLR